MPKMNRNIMKDSISIPTDTGIIHGDLALVADSLGLIIFAHGSGSGRKSPRNQLVARINQQHGLATLLIDLLTEEEEAEDLITRAWRFDIPFLAQRLQAVSVWVRKEPRLARLGVGYFGASTGAAAALIAAARNPDIRAVVSRGGRPDLAMNYLPLVSCPTLLLVGSEDYQVIELNKQAEALLSGPKRLEIIPGATHLFEEPGTLELVAQEASQWFLTYLPIAK